MELEELKNTWLSLDERLKKQEMLKETIVKEMLKAKVAQSTNRLINYEGIAIVILILLIPFIIYSLSKYGGNYLMWDLLIAYSGLVVIIYLPWAIYKICGLMKFDMYNNISNNIYIINRYNLHINREKLALSFVGVGFPILGILTYAQMNASIPLWVFLFCMLILATLYSLWSYRKMKKNIEVIKRNLEELTELEEDK